MRMSSLRLGLALHALFVVHLGKDLRVQATTSSLLTTCNATSPQSVGDGSCDSDNNHEDCEYDGGDCCPCTCEDADYSCGAHGFDCQDPTVTDDCSDTTSTSTDDFTSETYPDCEGVGGILLAIGSGYCTSVNNNEQCGYDGGDCCPCTCVSHPQACGSTGYDCQDPMAPSKCSQSSSSVHVSGIQCTGDINLVGNGVCDAENNNAYCDYDGGDCCSCTCFDAEDFPCGDGSYDCHDPDANCRRTLGPGGVALITGVAVFVLMLCCYFVTRVGVINRIRGGQDAPESSPKAPRTQGAIVLARNAGARMTSISMPSAPVLYRGYVVQVGVIEQQKTTIPEPTAPPLPHVSAVENEGAREKKASDPKCLAPSLPQGPGHTDIENNGEDVIHTSDPKAPTPPSSADTCAVEEGTEERKTLY